MTNIHIKACPKCGGDLYRQSDAYGPYISCFQCGHYLTQAQEASLMLATALLPDNETYAESEALEPVAA